MGAEGLGAGFAKKAEEVFQPEVPQGQLSNCLGYFSCPDKGFEGFSQGEHQVYTAPVTEIRLTGLGFRILQDFGISEILG